MDEQRDRSGEGLSKTAAVKDPLGEWVEENSTRATTGKLSKKAYSRAVKEVKG